MIGIQFLLVLKQYIIEVLPALVIGFFLSGLIHEFVPIGQIKKYLGSGGIVPILYSTFVGTLLPLCCIGTLPIGLGLYKRGAKLGPVLAFLVATPATSITALLVTYSLLGIRFTGFLFFSVILLGIVIGTIGNFLNINPERTAFKEGLVNDPVCRMNIVEATATTTEYNGKSYYFCSPHCKATFIKEPVKY
ncbi:MAG: permease [bacterium]|nr:permease [bacterium]